MKPSDIFAVPIDTDDSRRLLESKGEQCFMEEDLLGLRFVFDLVLRISSANPLNLNSQPASPPLSVQRSDILQSNKY